MIYVDNDLCAGCGICVNVCKFDAMAMEGDFAVIDQALCTACGRCIEVCPTDAILTVEVDPDIPAEQSVETPVVAVPSSPLRSESAQPGIRSADRAVSGEAGALSTLGKVVTGLIGIADYAIEHELLPLRRKPSTGRTVTGTSRHSGSGRPCRREGSGRGGGRGGRRSAGSGRSNRPGAGRRAHRQKRSW